MASLFDITGFGSTCVTAVEIILAIKNCVNGHKRTLSLLNQAEQRVKRIKDSSHKLAVFVELHVVEMQLFCRTVSEFHIVKRELEEVHEKQNKKTRLMRLFTASERAIKLESICSKLQRMEEDIDRTTQISRVDVKVSGALEIVAQLLDRINCPRVEKAKRLLAELAPNIGTRMDRLMLGAGGVESLFHLTMGKSYFGGEYGAKDYNNSAAHFRKAERFGCVDACYYLGNLYSDKDWNLANESEAFQFYLRGARAGHKEAQFEAGWCFEEGIGVWKDVHRAFRYYKSAADAGNVSATLNLGTCFAHGVGTEMDTTKAAHCYKIAAEAGSDGGMFNFSVCLLHGVGVEQDEEFALELFRDAADAGSSWAFERLGFCYRLGKGVVQDLTKAFGYYHEAAELGNVQASVDIGYCLVEGIGVERNAAEGERRLREAARTGEPRAWFHLGHCLRYGRGGIKRDGAEAFDCFQRAADGGSMRSHFLLAEFYRLGDVVAHDINKAIQNYSIAASYSVVEAQLSLAEIYESGLGVMRSMDRALVYYFMAADLGHQKAKHKIGTHLFRTTALRRMRLSQEEKLALIRGVHTSRADDDLRAAIHGRYLPDETRAGSRVRIRTRR